MKSNRYLFLKVFIPFLIAFMSIGIISFLSIEEFNKKYQDIRTKEILTNIQNIYDNKLNENYKLYKEITENLTNDKNIEKLFLQKDRQKLYTYTKKIYTRLNKEFQVTHFYFHNLDKTNFLRVHNPKKHSDLIDRFTLDEAHKTKNVSSGVEFGVAHNLTSRYVTPYYINSKLVGFIELGEEIDYLTPYLSKILDAEILIALKKELIDLDNLRLMSRYDKIIDNYPETNRYYIINSTMKHINQELKDFIDKEIDINNLKSNITSTHDIGLINLYDIENNNVGELIVLINTQNSKVALDDLKYVIFILLTLVSISIIFFYYIYIKNITKELNKSTKEIIKLTNTDQLTSLYNRRYFNEQLPIEINKAARLESDISFIMIDIDNFKLYNDFYGHHKGDIALQKVSKVLKESLKRSTDIAFRLGGEEFGIFIIEDSKNHSAKKLAKKILENIVKEDIEHKHNLPYKKITLSIGIATEKATMDLTIDNLYKTSDDALYKAKENGKNRVEVF